MNKDMSGSQNVYDNLYVFGCSFTLYKWPTWADYLYAGGISKGYKNWGLPGGSNDFIFHSVTECIATEHITSKDIVMIMWSQPHRIADYTHETGWDMPGNAHLYQDKERMIKYWNEHQSTLENLSYFYGTNNILKSIGCDFLFTSIERIRLHTDYVKQFDNITKTFYTSVGDVLGYTPRDKNETDWRETLPGDRHPSPKEHATYAKKLWEDLALPIQLNEEEIDKLANEADNYIFNVNQNGKVYYPEKIPLHRLPNKEGKVNTGNGKLINVSQIQPQ